VLKELEQLGLVETSDGKTYYRPAPMASGLSEFLSDFVEKHRFD
jgi:sugar-specific transcriptional regulator TrmB